MAEQNPYQSPQPSDEQPHVLRRSGWRAAMALVLWFCWTIGLFLGFLFAIHYFAQS